MLFYQFLNGAQLMIAEPAGPADPNRIQPELRSGALASYMHVRWLQTLRRVEKEPIGSYVVNRRHSAIARPLGFISSLRLARYQPYDPAIC